MVIFKIDSEYADEDFSLLGRHLRLLDIELSQINASMGLSQDPETDGLCDAGEYFIGSGFVAVQRYLTAARTACGVSVADAFIVPPMLTGGLSFAAAINAAANYWKHMDEWIVTLNKSDEADLHRSAQRTLQQIETITPWEEYTCANLLAVLVKGQKLELSRLLPEISQWRHNLMTGLSPKSE